MKESQFLGFMPSKKYYISTLLVLRLAQSGGGAGQNFAKGLPILSKFFAKKRDDGEMNPLMINLEKVELRDRPFVSIHIALYNEKRVVERLIKTLSVQDYPNYEVVIAY